MDLVTKKKQIRKEIKEKRDLLTFEEREIMDKEILNAITQHESYKKAKFIFTYVSVDKEVDTRNFILKAFQDNKKICVPLVISKAEGMVAVEIQGFQDLKEGSYGLLEPISAKNLVPPEEIDFILMPGAAFDLKGGRVGYGGGFYDRFLRKVKSNIPKVGIAYPFQIIDEIPMEAFDERITDLISSI